MSSIKFSSRQEIEDLIKAKKDFVDKAKDEIDKLSKEWYLFSDDKQWFIEQNEMCEKTII